MEKEIHSLKELIFYGAEVARTNKLQEVRLDGDFLLALHIKGQSWDKRVDYRSAQYIVALQKAIDTILEDFGGNADHKKVLIKVDVKEGSFDAWAEVKDVLTVMVAKMNDVETFVCFLVALLSVGGYFWLTRYLAYREHVTIEDEHTKQVEAQEKTRAQRDLAQNQLLMDAIQTLREHADPNPNRFVAYERPLKKLVSTLEEKDLLRIAEVEMDIPAEDAKKCAPPRAPRSESQITYADGEYIVNSRRYDEGEVVLELEQSGVKIKGYLWQLDDTDREAFISSLDRHERKDNLPFYMKLQLNVEHTQRLLKHAVILGEGKPREGKRCLPLNEILSK